jgi:UDP-N-acetylglucosamine:LPS N-acetylglucosamine transferase
LNDYPADLYISTFYADTEIFKEIKKFKPNAKTVMVVVDIMHALRLWFEPKTDLNIVPTQEIFNQGSKYFKGYQNKVEIFGLPIAQNIFNNISKEEMKKKLGLNINPMIFIAGGGEGMEQVPKIVEAIDKSNRNLTLCVVCGKDIPQKEYLQKHKYNNEVKVLGWVDNFTEYVLACDIVITKAGPATVWETISAGRKMILYGFIGGVEEGDVAFAINNGNVVSEKNPNKIADLIPSLLSQPDPKISELFKTNWAIKIAKRLMDL